MSASETFLETATFIALGLLSVSFLITVFKVIKGPTLPDRILALDMLVAVAIGFIAVMAIKTGFTLYIDIAIALGLVGFLATVAFARFILARGKTEYGETSTDNVVGPSVPATPVLNRMAGAEAVQVPAAPANAGAKKRPASAKSRKSSARKKGK